MTEKWKEMSSNMEQAVDLVDISVVLDRSGSMTSIRNDVIGGFNEFLHEQQAMKGKVSFTLVRFDNIYEIVYNGLDIQEVPDLDSKVFQPRNLTALLDAIGKTINVTEERVKTSKADRVIFLIITDGLENASHEFKKSDIMKTINSHREEDNWEFVFIGANQDSIQEGASFGITSGSAVDYVADTQGTFAMFADVSQNLSYTRNSRKYKAGNFNNQVDDVDGNG